MLEVARANAPRGVGFKDGRAEDLPFKDEWFERAVMWLSAHLVDRPAAFRETRRVLAQGGKLAVVSFDPVHFERYWLNELFPSIQRIDRARFPTEEGLQAELEDAGFGGMRFVWLSQRATIDREEALERVRGHHISTFDLLDEEELREGTERAERELPEVIEYALEWMIAVAER
jgi:SAM-dependent methyltransferase